MKLLLDTVFWMGLSLTENPYPLDVRLLLPIYHSGNIIITQTMNKKISVGDTIYISTKTGKVVKTKRKGYTKLGIAISSPDKDNYIQVKML